MIDNQSLMVGNLFYPSFDREIVIPSTVPMRVSEILFNGVRVIDLHREDSPFFEWKHVHSIPLSPSILEAVGFVQIGSAYGLEINYDIKLWSGNGKVVSCYSEYGFEFGEAITTLHRLQNTVFILTGTHLDTSKIK